MHFIILDDVEYLGQDSTGRSGGYRGFLKLLQLRWIENDLHFVPPGNLVVIAMHIPIYSRDSYDAEGVNVINREKLFSLLEDRKYLLTLAGHMHDIDQFNYDEAAGRLKKSPFYTLVGGAACGA